MRRAAEQQTRVSSMFTSTKWVEPTKIIWKLSWKKKEVIQTSSKQLLRLRRKLNMEKNHALSEEEYWKKYTGAKKK